MSDVINGVLRDDLKSLLVAIEGTMWADAQWVARCRALLTAQPQASAAQSAHADESGVVKVARDILAILQHPTRSVTAMDMWKLEDALKAHDEAAQSAPAGERETFEQLWAMRGADDEGNPGPKPLRSLAEPQHYRGDAVNGSWVWFQRGAAWQRTQSAKPEAIKE